MHIFLHTKVHCTQECKLWLICLVWIGSSRLLPLPCYPYLNLTFTLIYPLPQFHRTPKCTAHQRAVCNYHIQRKLDHMKFIMKDPNINATLLWYTCNKVPFIRWIMINESFTAAMQPIRRDFTNFCKKSTKLINMVKYKICTTQNLFL